MSQTEERKLEVNLTAEEYGEILAKLANQIEAYGDQVSISLILAFVKLDSAKLYRQDEFYQTKLMWRIRSDFKEAYKEVEERKL